MIDRKLGQGALGSLGSDLHKVPVATNRSHLDDVYKSPVLETSLATKATSSAICGGYGHSSVAAKDSSISALGPLLKPVFLAVLHNTKNNYYFPMSLCMVWI